MEEPQALPEADKAFLDEVIQATRDLYASLGTMSAFAVIKTAPNLLPNAPGNAIVLSLPGLGGSDSSKRRALGTVRHHSIRLASPMTAIVTECWTVQVKENTERELLALRRRGKGMGDHPEAYELVTIVLESENGRSTHSLTIDRRHEDMTVLTPREDDLRFDSWSALHTKNAGIIQLMINFHVRLQDRIRPEIITWAREMDAEFGDPRLERAKAPAKSILPSRH